MILVFRPLRSVISLIMEHIWEPSIQYDILYKTLNDRHKLITIPNSTMTTASITNFSAKELRLWISSLLHHTKMM
jgi:hypothetical protein